MLLEQLLINFIATNINQFPWHMSIIKHYTVYTYKGLQDLSRDQLVRGAGRSKWGALVAASEGRWWQLVRGAGRS